MQGLHLLHDAAGQRAAGLPAGQGRTRLEQPFQEQTPNFAANPGAGLESRNLTAPGQQGTQADHCDQVTEMGCQQGARLGLDKSVMDDASHQGGLGDHQKPSGNALGGGQGDPSASARGLAKKPLPGGFAAMPGNGVHVETI